MDGAASGKHFKNNLKLVLCAIGIVLVVAILIAMRPIQSSKNAISRPAPAGAHNASNLSTLAQAAPINQAASAAAATGVSITTSSNPQSGQPSSVPPPSNSMPAVVSLPVTPGPDRLYPIDPAPCNSFKPMSNIGCGTCETAPDTGSFAGCRPRCPTGGIEIMCSYP